MYTKICRKPGESVWVYMYSISSSPTFTFATTCAKHNTHTLMSFNNSGRHYLWDRGKSQRITDFRWISNSWYLIFRVQLIYALWRLGFKIDTRKSDVRYSLALSIMARARTMFISSYSPSPSSLSLNIVLFALRCRTEWNFRLCSSFEYQDW